MKKQLLFKILTVAIFTFFLHGFIVAQNYEASKTLNKTATVPENIKLTISNQSGDLKFITTNENVIQIKTEIEISGSSEEEVNKIIQAIESFEFKQSGNNFNIDTRFYKSINSINNRNTITLLNGDKIKIGEFKIRHELHIPKTASLELNNKYSDIEMQSLDGDAKISLYSSKLSAQDFSAELTIEAKYSKISLKNIKQKANINFYDSDLEFTSCGDANIQSKYSKFEGGKMEKLVINSYDDKFMINELSRLNLNAKYSDFISEASVSEIHLDLYDCNIQVKSAEKGTYRGKYSDLKLGNVKKFDVSESYDDNFYFGKTGEIKINESKYSLYEINETSLFTLDGYDDTVTIGSLNSDFSGVNMTGKYGKLNVNTGGTDFQVYFNIKYPKLDIPKSIKIIKQIENNSELEFVGNDLGGKITVEGYDMKVVIK